LPPNAPRGGLERSKKVEKSFGIAPAVGAARQCGLITHLLGEFTQAVMEPPAQRAEPENHAINQGELLGECVTPGHMREFMNHDSVERVVIPLAPICRKQD
jgi:hypothetical protein